jgi:hypothetical protein
MAVCVVLALALCGSADIYMHNPRGSNNKLNEVQNDAKNQARLFDSQNNARGGYQVGDNCAPVCSDGKGAYDAAREGAGKGTMRYFEGSRLPIEWTSQHSSGAIGTAKAQADVILQYMCREDLRDGTDTKTVEADAEGAKDPSRGLHEPFEFYRRCKLRERNKGLFVADQSVGTNVGATATRQNPNGERHGLECAEERDYYPYWHPTPWRDIAVLTSNTSRCDYYRTNSENVVGRYQCIGEAPGVDAERCNNAACCTKLQGRWELSTPHGGGAPECIVVRECRDNHLGNCGGNEVAHYNWTLPRVSEILGSRAARSCVLRIRYNISAHDVAPTTDAAKNGRMLGDGPGRSPLIKDPYGYVPTEGGLLCDWSQVEESQSNPAVLRLAIDTTQVSRVFQASATAVYWRRSCMPVVTRVVVFFQDRSHLFTIVPRPEGMRPDATIWNLNVRGRRGNIVQVTSSRRTAGILSP